MFLEPVTLYSPASTHKHYLIRRVDSSTYYVHWYQLSSAYMTHSLASFGFTSYAISSLSIKSSETVANTAISVTASTASSGTYYMSSAYSSFDDAVAAIQSPDTVYTKKSSSNSKLSISTESGYNFSATNIPALAFDESYAKAKRLSKNEIIEIIIPKNVDIERGSVVNETIPSIEYLKSPQNDQLVSPATRSTFSYSSHFVLNPTHSKRPFEKRLYSLSSRSESATWRVINR